MARNKRDTRHMPNAVSASDVGGASISPPFGSAGAETASRCFPNSLKGKSHEMTRYSTSFKYPPMAFLTTCCKHLYRPSLFICAEAFLGKDMGGRHFVEFASFLPRANKEGLRIVMFLFCPSSDDTPFHHRWIWCLSSYDLTISSSSRLGQVLELCKSCADETRVWLACLTQSAGFHQPVGKTLALIGTPAARPSIGRPRPKAPGELL